MSADTHCSYCSQPYGPDGEYGYCYCPARRGNNDALYEQAQAYQAGYLAALGDVDKDFKALYLSYCREPGNINPEHTTDWTTPLWSELEKILNKLKSRAGGEERSLDPSNTNSQPERKE